jgi:NAD(P)H-hydrate epimerase
MEHAGTAVAAAARALVAFNGREGRPVLVLAGPGNNGGDGFVAARRLAEWGVPVIAVLVATGENPRTHDAKRNWLRLDGIDGVTRIHAGVARDVAILGQGIERAAIVVDALLGTGVRGQLREPVRSAVELIHRARELSIPVLAVDTPTAVDLTSGDPSDPVVRADLTVTFHRPKTGLRTRVGRALAGRVLVAPIGIPPEADRG